KDGRWAKFSDHVKQDRLPGTKPVRQDFPNRPRTFVFRSLPDSLDRRLRCLELGSQLRQVRLSELQHPGITLGPTAQGNPAIDDPHGFGLDPVFHSATSPLRGRQGQPEYWTFVLIVDDISPLAHKLVSRFWSRRTVGDKFPVSITHITCSVV